MNSMAFELESDWLDSSHVGIGFCGVVHSGWPLRCFAYGTRYVTRIMTIGDTSKQKFVK